MMGRYDNKIATVSGFKNLEPWPEVFNTGVVAIERTGVILRDGQIKTPDDVVPVEGSLEAIKLLRLKGYKVSIFFNEPLISEGILTADDVDRTNVRMMEIFGEYGIQSIDGVLYSTTNMKQDIYSMPNTGMMKKAEKEQRIKFKGGYFVGNKIRNLKAGNSLGCVPVLVKTGIYQETLEKLDSFANRELRMRTKTFQNLLEFVNSLPS
jgi:D-glycero-D-manno-heptose 1,7-bisphosphate phosphatase